MCLFTSPRLGRARPAAGSGSPSPRGPSPGSPGLACTPPAAPPCRHTPRRFNRHVAPAAPPPRRPASTLGPRGEGGGDLNHSANLIQTHPEWKRAGWPQHARCRGRCTGPSGVCESDWRGNAHSHRGGELGPGRGGRRALDQDHLLGRSGPGGSVRCYCERLLHPSRVPLIASRIWLKASLTRSGSVAFANRLTGARRHNTAGTSQEARSVLSQRSSAWVAGGPCAREASVWGGMLLARWCYKHVLNCLTSGRSVRKSVTAVCMSASGAGCRVRRWRARTEWC